VDGTVPGPFGIVGAGVIGAGWAARALARGYEVVAFDPAPGARERLESAVERA
jgi:carnitine 3-dehydrogenase